MIVATDELRRYRDEVAMIDGGFDPLHGGHIEYMREAAALGAPVLCNVSPDTWIERKHAPLLPQHERVQVVDAIRFVDYTHPSSWKTVDVLRELRPRFYVKGSDWRGRLPEVEVAVCAEQGTEIVYLDTVLNSSTQVLKNYVNALQGCVQ